MPWKTRAKMKNLIRVDGKIACQALEQYQAISPSNTFLQLQTSPTRPENRMKVPTVKLYPAMNQVRPHVSCIINVQAIANDTMMLMT